MTEIPQVEVVATEPVTVDIRSVEKQIGSLWRKAAEGGMPGVSAPVTRILLSNLLVYAQSDTEADEAREVISEIAANHPTRTVIADAGPGEQGHELEADVSMLCSVSEQGRWLCGEEVRLHAHGNALTSLGTIIPILVPDLPIFLWTPGDITPDDQVLGHLTHVSDHWIIDSRRFKSWTDRFRLVVSLGPRHEPPVMLHDLAWTSLSQWREAVAQHFDPQPGRQYLQGINRVRISYGAQNEPKPEVSPLLMAAWLMSQLQWENPVANKNSDGGWSITAATEGREVIIDLQPVGEPLAVREIIIESEIDGKHGAFRSTLSESTGEFALETSAPDLPNVRRTITSGRGALCNHLCQVLDAPGQDRLYQQALPLLQGILFEIEARV